MKVKLILGLCILLTLLLVGCGKTVYIDKAFISDFILEGHDFKFLFTVINKWDMSGNVTYEYRFNPDCIELKGLEEGQIYLHRHLEKKENPFYTNFHVKENLSLYCYAHKQTILLIISNSEETLDTIQVSFWIPLATSKIQEIQKFEKFTKGIL